MKVEQDHDGGKKHPLKLTPNFRSMMTGYQVVLQQYYKLIAILSRQYRIILTVSWEKIYSVFDFDAYVSNPAQCRNVQLHFWNQSQTAKVRRQYRVILTSLA